MLGALVIQENIWWATEEEAANPSVLPEDRPVDRSLPAAFKTSSQVSTERSPFQGIGFGVLVYNYKHSLLYREEIKRKTEN